MKYEYTKLILLVKESFSPIEETNKSKKNSLLLFPNYSNFLKSFPRWINWTSDEV